MLNWLLQRNLWTSQFSSKQLWVGRGLKTEILPRLTQKIVTSPMQLLCGKHWTLGSILPWTMFSKCVLQLGREEMSLKMPRWWWQDGAPFQRGGLRWYFWRQLEKICSRKCSTLSSGNCSNGGNSDCNIQLCMWFWFHLWQEPYNVNFDHIQKILHHWLIKSFRPQNHFVHFRSHQRPTTFLP